MSISTGFPLFRIFFFSWFTQLTLAHWDVSAIGASITSGVSPVGLVHCTAPAPFSLLVHGNLFLLLCIRVSVCLLFSTLTSHFLLFSPSSKDALCLPLRWLQISVPSFLLSFLVLYFFPGKMYISAIPLFTSLRRAASSLPVFPILTLPIHIAPKLLHVCSRIFIPVPTTIFIYFQILQEIMKNFRWY